MFEVWILSDIVTCHVCALVTITWNMNTIPYNLSKPSSFTLDILAVPRLQKKNYTTNSGGIGKRERRDGSVRPHLEVGNTIDKKMLSTINKIIIDKL